MNKKEILGLCEFLKLHGFENTDNILKFIFGLQQENKQLKIQISAREEVCSRIAINWNKLKEYIKETKLKEFEKSYGKRYGKTFTQAEIIVCNMILDKMQELEGSDSNVKD